ncbi:MAG TPA: MFS transporter [Candidatus Dormibacteraeota bacterium]
MSYSEVFRTRGVKPLVSAMVLARFGGQAYGLILVLFALDRFHSPALAGLVGLVGILPGLGLSPIAGALLDRFRRSTLVVVDYLLGALTGLTLALLAVTGTLNPPLLLLVAAISSLTIPFALAGPRSLLPMLLERRLWDRGNAIDSATLRLTSILGPALGGLVVAWVGATAAVAAVGATWMLAGLFLTRVHEPPVTPPESHVLSESWQGLRYVLRNRVLRNLSVVMPLANITMGILLVALPVLVLTRLHGGPAQVGLLWSVAGLMAAAGNVTAGRVRTEGRENRIMAAGMALSALPLLLVAGTPSLLLAAAGMALFGLCSGPVDVAMFGLRLRASDSAWFGRAISISIAISFAGNPIGSGLAGPLIGWGVGPAIVVAALASLGAGVLAWPLLRPAAVTTVPPAVLREEEVPAAV